MSRLRVFTGFAMSRIVFILILVASLGMIAFTASADVGIPFVTKSSCEARLHKALDRAWWDAEGWMLEREIEIYKRVIAANAHLPAEESLVCPARTAYVLVVGAPEWGDSSLGIQSLSGGRIELSNCNAPLSSVTLVPNGVAAIDGWTAFRCGGSGVRVEQIAVPEGTCATFSTESVFRDGEAVVEILELPAPLAEDSGSYRFPGVRSFGLRSTFVALMSDGPTRAEVTFYDGENNFVSRSEVPVDSYTLFEAPATVFSGSVVVKNIGSGVGPAASGKLFAATIVGYRANGSPRSIPAEVLP